ncbi:hypothetical protein BV898_09178 [Hypsibius exemplaris]|uniref:Uncharacterized protein n=1 Tax=Hypsibius exemplaris TaxID=2072580 RepID=A0A1W0WND1_HYPEX|nr:hypothetical protein BV898_09178 [Hypsibius exemplaris]
MALSAPKRSTSIILSSLNCTVAVISLLLHTEPLLPDIARPIFRQFFLSTSAIWWLSAAGSLLGLAELLTVLGSTGSRLFWSALLMTGGWGMLLKTVGSGVDHLIVSGLLSALSLSSLMLSLQVHSATEVEQINRELPVDVEPQPPRTPSKPIVNPGFNVKFPTKSPRRHTLALDSTARRDCEFGCEQQGQIALLGKSYRVNVSDNVIRNDFPESQSELPVLSRRLRHAGLKDHSTAISVIPAISKGLPALTEDVKDTGNSPTIPSTTLPTARPHRSRVSQGFTMPGHLIASAIHGNHHHHQKPMRWTERIARLLAGLLLGSCMLVAVAGCIVLLDGFYHVPIVEDVARVFRGNAASLRQTFLTLIDFD